MEPTWHCYMCVRQEVTDHIQTDHEYLGLVMINGTSYCLWHARQYARRALSTRQPIRALPARLAGRRRNESKTGEGSQ